MKREFVEVTYTIDGITKTSYIRKNKLHNIRESLNQAFKCNKCAKPHKECWCLESAHSLKETRNIFRKVCHKNNVTEKQAGVFRHAVYAQDLNLYLSYNLDILEATPTLEELSDLVQKIDKDYQDELRKLSNESLERLVNTAKTCNRAPITVDIAISELAERELLKD